MGVIDFINYHLIDRMYGFENLIKTKDYVVSRERIKHSNCYFTTYYFINNGDGPGGIRITEKYEKRFFDLLYPSRSGNDKIIKEKAREKLNDFLDEVKVEILHEHPFITVGPLPI